MLGVKRLVWLAATTGAASIAAAASILLTQRPVHGQTLLYLLTVPVPFLAAGVLIVVRHPENRSGSLLVCGTTATMGYSALLERFVVDTFATNGATQWMSWALLVEALVMMPGLACLALLIAFFPTGRPETAAERRYARWVWLLPLPMLVALLSNEHVLVEQITYGAVGPFENPLFLNAMAWLGPATEPMRSILGSVLFVSIGFLVNRYRRAATTERQQVRWVLFGSATALVIGLVPFIIGPLLEPGSIAHDGLPMTLGAIALLIIPVTMVIAIEQPAWIDVDEVIRKTFTYGALSIGIFVIYAAVAAGLGLAAGARLPLEVAIGVTAVLAFAFQPARRRLQLVADRWVFGDQPSPIEAVARFDRSVRGPEAPTDTAQLLADTVRRAARLRWVTVELSPESTHTSGVRRGEPDHETPIALDEVGYGRIVCGPKMKGQFTDTDHDLIEALAGQAALVISNARLATRLVQAQEAERRRLERNIHDGAQQELVALVAKLGLARARARQGALDDTTLLELQRDAGMILKELRELAQGIHPSVLTDGGLVEAVQDRCSRLPIDVTVAAKPGLRAERFNDDVEGAAYFFVTEGLTNILKHAGAARVEVAIDRANGHLELRVVDDGAGFDPTTTHWNGLEGLRDRFTALSGEVTVRSRPGRGTVLEGRIPIEDPR